jgi:hypothetical protein
MADSWEPPSRGALDDTAWPEMLIARVVERGTDDDRVNGYGVLADVARNYSFTDLVYLGLVGELPTPVAARQFQIVMAAAAPVSVAEASVHAGVLARLSGAPIASALGTGLVIAADHARQVVENHAALLAWLDRPEHPAPESFRHGTDRAWVANLAAALREDRPKTLDDDFTRDAARLTVFHAAGLTTPDRIQAALVLAATVGVAAEALATGPEHLALYPVKLPPYRYVDDE